MKDGGRVGFTRVDWFNGGLFDDDAALPLEKRRHRRPARRRPPRLVPDRPLDPRHPLRARPRPRQAQPARRPLHRPRQDHEDREPGRRRAAAGGMGRDQGARSRPPSPREKAAARPPPRTARPQRRRWHSAPRFLERLKSFRVLDPACGSGNFLYLALRALKDIEHRVNLEAEALGLPRGFPRRPRGGPRHRAQPLRRRARPRLGLDRRDPVDARQRLRRLANPILRPLDTIECRDASSPSRLLMGGRVTTKTDDDRLLTCALST